jgi:hypothetical protein
MRPRPVSRPAKFPPPERRGRGRFPRLKDGWRSGVARAFPRLKDGLTTEVWLAASTASRDDDGDVELEPGFEPLVPR